MKQLMDIYGDNLIMLFDSSKLKNDTYKALAVIRSDAQKQQINGVLTMNYDEDFESLLNYKIPPKTRKQRKLMSLMETMDVVERMRFATIGCVIDDMPYTYAMNYVLVDGHIYFHTGRKGYKLKALGSKASVNIVEDLGLASNGGHNFRSVQIYGTLVENEDHDLKEKVLLEYITGLNPKHSPYVESMQESTLVYEIEIEYMLGRKNIYLP